MAQRRKKLIERVLIGLKKKEAGTIQNGFKLLRTFAAAEELLSHLAVTPDGLSVVSQSVTGRLRFWDLESGKLRGEWQKHPGKTERPGINSLAVTDDFVVVPSKSTLQILRLPSFTLINELESPHERIYSIAATADGRTILAACGPELCLWNPATGDRKRWLTEDEGPIYSVALTLDGHQAASGGDDGKVRVWDLDSAKMIASLEGHRDPVNSVGVTRDGRMIVSCSSDRTVRLWDIGTHRCLRTLEGHRAAVAGLTLRNGCAATLSRDVTVRLWDLNTGRCLAQLAAQEPLAPHHAPLAFTPDGSKLLTASASERGHINVWRLDWEVLGSARGEPTQSYRNAKVVLVGDTGVGKSGLATVLAGRKFQLTESTHGRKVWLFESKKHTAGGESQTRETLLWDLAGQPGYRLVHQLNIDQAVVALVLVDARSETDPLGPAEYWARAIEQAKSDLPIHKFLVVSRVDRGGLAVSPEEIRSFAERHGFLGVFETSAKTGKGISQLAQAVRQAIPWDQIVEVVSSRLFGEIKEFLLREKEQGNKALGGELEDLFARFVKRTGAKATLAGFTTCVLRMDAAGLVAILRFQPLEKPGNPVSHYVLLQPEFIDAYASAAVMTAKNDPRGIGEVREARLLAGEIELDERERLPDKELERVVLAATVEDLLKRDCALRETLDDGDYLVFPSEYRRQSPYPRKHAPGVSFEFQGAPKNVFTTLVVRLAHHRDFENVEFYRDAACYSAKAGGRCAVLVNEPNPGVGRLSIYFEDNPDEGEQRAFLQFVRDHLASRAKIGTVRTHRLYFCRACGHTLDEQAVEIRLKQGDKDIVCPVCETRSSLIDLLRTGDSGTRQDAARMQEDADSARRRQVATTAITEKKRTGKYDVFLSYNTKDREQVVELAEALIAVGIRPWLDVWDLVPGRPWQEGLNEAVTSIHAAAVCVGRTGLGPWQDHEVMAFLRKFVKRKAPVIPVLLVGANQKFKLPPLLESFSWVDLRSGTTGSTLPRIVAGILGERPGDMMSDRLEEQVASMLATQKRPQAGRGKETVVLPVSLETLNPDDLEAIRQQTARLLRIPSSQLIFKGTRKGSVKVILEFDDFNAVSRLFAMVDQSDPDLQEFFKRCQIDRDRFVLDNEEVKERIIARRQKRGRGKDSEPQVSLALVPERDLTKWTGGAKVMTVAVVFTDIVDSAKLCVDLGDATWEGILQQHFKLAVTRINERGGILIKNTGDGLLALFHDAESATRFALSLHDNTGHAVVRIRAGLHVGQVEIFDKDAFGRHVNLAASVMGFASGDGVIASDRVKQDIDHRGESKQFIWTEFPEIALKGFPKPETLWRVQVAEYAP